MEKIIKNPYEDYHWYIDKNGIRRYSNIETMDDLKKYLDSDEYKSMGKEIMELVKKSEINNIKYACSFVYDDKDNIIGRFRNIEKENEQKWKKQN
jgi:hypothetical protein